MEDVVLQGGFKWGQLLDGIAQEEDFTWSGRTCRNCWGRAAEEAHGGTEIRREAVSGTGTRAEEQNTVLNLGRGVAAQSLQQ